MSEGTPTNLPERLVVSPTEASKGWLRRKWDRIRNSGWVGPTLLATIPTALFFSPLALSAPFVAMGMAAYLGLRNEGKVGP